MKFRHFPNGHNFAFELALGTVALNVRGLPSYYMGWCTVCDTFYMACHLTNVRVGQPLLDGIVEVDCRGLVEGLLCGVQCQEAITMDSKMWLAICVIILVPMVW